MLSIGALAAAGVAAIDVASLALLGLFEWLEIERSFEWGHVAVTALAASSRPETDDLVASTISS